MLRRMVLAQALRMIMYGMALGVPAAWIAGRWLASALTDVSPHDPLTFAVAGAGLMIVGSLRRLVACSPGRRGRSDGSPSLGVEGVDVSRLWTSHAETS